MSAEREENATRGVAWQIEPDPVHPGHVWIRHDYLPGQNTWRALREAAQNDAGAQAKKEEATWMIFAPAARADDLARVATRVLGQSSGTPRTAEQRAASMAPIAVRRKFEAWEVFEESAPALRATFMARGMDDAKAEAAVNQMRPVVLGRIEEWLKSTDQFARTFKPSPYQQAVFDWIRDGQGNAFVEAVAGSGKSTTLIQAAKRLRMLPGGGGRKLFVAFNKSIANDLKVKLPESGVVDMTVATLNGFGWRYVLADLGGKGQRDDFLDAFKYVGKKWRDKNTGENVGTFARHRALLLYSDKEGYYRQAEMFCDSIAKIIALAMSNLVEWQDADAMAETIAYYGLEKGFPADPETIPGRGRKLYGVTPEPMPTARMIEEAQGLIRFGTSEEFLRGNVRGVYPVANYDEQIYLAVVPFSEQRTDSIETDVANKRRATARDKYDWIFVDEAQDLNRMQMALIRSAMHERTRVIFVGDRYQSIYAFRGADSSAVPNIIAEFNCTQLPLSICYRCAVRIVEEAQKVIPATETGEARILPRDDAPLGEVVVVSATRFAEEARPGDMVLCRRNGPLVQAAMDALAKGKPVQIVGKEIAGQINRLILKITKGNPSFNMATEFESAWEQASSEDVEALFKRHGSHRSKEMIENAESEYAAVMVIRNSRPAWSEPKEMMAYVNSLFSASADEGGDSGKIDPKTVVRFSTVHKAKGLENPRVFWLEYNYKAPTDREWERQQEVNIQYVAITRAQEVLFLIPSESEIVGSATAEAAFAGQHEVDTDESNEDPEFAHE